MTKEFLKAALIRAAHTFCQAALGAIGGTAMTSEVNWVTVLDVAALAAICSLLKSFAVGMPEIIDGVPIIERGEVE